MAEHLDMGPAILTCCSQAKTADKPKEQKEAEKEEEIDGS